MVIADWEGAPAGFALFFHNFSTFLGRPGVYLEDLFVEPEHRGRGIGRLEWWVLDWNEDVIRFYRSHGAVPMDEWTVYRVTGDALTAMAEL